ncbi:MAG: uracil phosphoribosyltransferase, partial [Bacteroidota bacterium]
MDTRVTVLGQGKSVLNHFLRELRDHEIQQDRMRFRRNLERVGEIMAYEISKQLSYHVEQVSTPLGELDMKLMDAPPVLVSVLRAGLP